MGTEPCVEGIVHDIREKDARFLRFQGSTVEEGAAKAVRLALLPDDGPTRGFIETGTKNPW